MQLHLSANTNTGYTPDWIQIEFQNPDRPQGLTTLTMDIQGTIDYDPNTFNVRVKGELVPWTIVEPNGKETDLSECSKIDVDIYVNMFNEHIQKSHNIIVGVTPTDENVDEIDEDETFTNSIGTYQFIDSNGDTDFLFVNNFEVEVV